MYRGHEKHVILAFWRGYRVPRIVYRCPGKGVLSNMCQVGLLFVPSRAFFFFFRRLLFYGIIARRGGLSSSLRLALRSLSVGTRAANDAA